MVLEGSIFCRRFLDREFRDSALGLVRRRDAELDWSIFGSGIRRRNRGTLLITLGQFPIFRSFFRILRFRVDALQSAAAERSFGEAGRPRVQRGQPLIDAQIVGCHRQRTDKWAQCLGRHVVRNEELRVGKSGAHRKRNLVRIMLVDRRRGSFQILYQYDGLFGGNEFVSGGAAELAHHLLVILHVQGVGRFDRGQLLVKVASAR